MAAATSPTTLTTTPRYEGANICTWIGFKHVNYLVEEAVLDHLRKNGAPAGLLYERHGLCVDLVDVDTKMFTAFHVDDVVVATVRRLPDAGGQLRLSVLLTTRADPDTKVARATVGVVLRADPRGLPAEPAPAALLPHVVGELGEPATVPLTGDPVAQLTRDRNAFAWSWRVPYPYCHFTERVQLSGYLRLMEEAVDLFLADRGVSIKTLLDEDDLIPVVPRSHVRIVGEAKMEERVHTAFTVTEVFKDLTYTAAMDCYVTRGGALVPVATGTITHGYAIIDSRRDWSVVPFPERLAAALGGAR
ncbi:hypothetical protein BJP25_24170 [Actinokineospora bangkokensis]|uniref:Thioesterase n=1 Tax=Actinokineospora bangkokensis TaxID=1193682 RepID=A0A1Q9LJ52_9PSEU|nr:hypothetical protein BJP25_24170 [Actinokineospora bangkokensis]